MKVLDRDKFGRIVAKARVHFGLTYYGKSNKMRTGCQWNDKAVDLGSMTDEQLVLLWQLVNSVLGMLAKEQLRRDLLPEEIAKIYRSAQSEEE